MAAGDEMNGHGHDDDFPDRTSLALRKACTASLESWKVLLSETERSKPQPHRGGWGWRWLLREPHIFGVFIDIYLKKPRKVPFLTGNYGWFSGKVDGN